MPLSISGGRGGLIAAAGCLAALTLLSDAAPPAGAAGSPDVTVFDFTDIASWGSADGFAAYSIGTRSCNRGDSPLNWCAIGHSCPPGVGPLDHPVIAQSLYRLEGGRFAQIGMSWVKHGFAALNGPAAGCAGAGGTACANPNQIGPQLLPGCTDPYIASTNGTRPLGRRSEVDATTGDFPEPMSPDGPYTVYDQRIKVATADVEPSAHAGALYFAEAQYVAKDDAAAGNAFNNASYRQVTVGGAPSYPLTMTGAFFEQQPALFAWRALDPAVALVAVDVPGTAPQRYHVARKVTELHDGRWHYEYAIHNLDSDRAARAFTVQFPSAATITGAGFQAPLYHSGEPYAGTPWTVSTTASSITWATDDFAADENANALRWATLDNFWFDADQPPSNGIGHALELFKPGSPATVSFAVEVLLLSDGFESGDTGAWSGGEGAAAPARAEVRATEPARRWR